MGRIDLINLKESEGFNVVMVAAKSIAVNISKLTPGEKNAYIVQH